MKPMILQRYSGCVRMIAVVLVAAVGALLCSTASAIGGIEPQTLFAGAVSADIGRQNFFSGNPSKIAGIYQTEAEDPVATLVKIHADLSVSDVK